VEMETTNETKKKGTAPP